MLLIGIAASSSFQTNRDVTLRPGQSADVDGRRVTYVRPTVSVDSEAFTASAPCSRVETGRQEFIAAPEPALLPADRGAGRRRSAASSTARRPARSGCKAGLRNDFWIASRPDISGVQRRARAADRASKPASAARPGTPPQCEAVAATDARGRSPTRRLAPRGARPDRRACRRRPRREIAQSYIAEGPPATFRVIVNPLVTWIWIGGLIALPARRSRSGRPAAAPRSAPAADPELEALKEAKYREIRDAELDHAAGKLSDEDFALLDAELRKEAVEILDRERRRQRPVGAAPAPLDLQQDDRVDDEEDGEEDRRPVEVALDHRAAAEGAAAAADAEGAGEARVFPECSRIRKIRMPAMITWMTAKNVYTAGECSH